MTTRLQGECHCGNLRVNFETPTTDELPIRTCSCSFCTKARARWTSIPTGNVRFAVQDPQLLSRYRFGTETADFLICSRCGVHVAAVCEIEDELYAVLNADAFASLSSITHAEEPADFSNETLAERLARRKRNWTPARWVESL